MIWRQQNRVTCLQSQSYDSASRLLHDKTYSFLTVCSDEAWFDDISILLSWRWSPVGDDRLSLSLLPPAWDPFSQTLQKTTSQDSQKSSSCWVWVEHLGMTSLLWLDIKSSNWLTRNEGGRVKTPPRGKVMVSLQMGHRKKPASRTPGREAIFSRHDLQTVWLQWSSLG